MSTNTTQKPGDRVLSVREAVDYIEEHFHAHIEGITHGRLKSESQVRRYLNGGVWPMTRTADGHMGIAERDLRALWTPRAA